MTFKILYPHKLEKELKQAGKKFLRSIPWELIKDHEAQAYKNHSQTLSRLNERGGLDPVEMYAVMNNLLWNKVKLSPLECLEWIEEQVQLHEKYTK